MKIAEQDNTASYRKFRNLASDKAQPSEQGGAGLHVQNLARFGGENPPEFATGPRAVERGHFKAFRWKFLVGHTIQRLQAKGEGFF